jgi:two-component system nitrogen regulation response regulator NtrX
MASDILIVDDEADIRDLVAGILDDEGFSTRTARDSDSALTEIANRRPHLVFLDIWLQGSKLDGLQLLEQIKKDNADLPVVMISGHGNIETAVAAIKRGAYDFIEKPFKSDRLILVATRALETSRLKREVKELKQLAPAASILTGRSACMNQLRQTIDRAAKANSRILIVGPSGSGKELAARTLHHASGRAEGPFVVINAAAITPERMEVELFGIEQSNGEQVRWKKPMAARCSSTKSPICRARPRTRSCACWSIRPFSAPAVPARCMSMSASSPRPRAIWKMRLRKGDSARISITGSRWCRSVFPRCRNGARTFLN